MQGVKKAPNLIPEEYRTQTVLVVDADSKNCPNPTSNHGSDGWNWGFADGHAEWVSRERTNDKFTASFHATTCP